MHNHGVTYKHTIVKCAKEVEGHVDTKTRTNPAMPDATMNNDWKNEISHPNRRGPGRRS